MDNNQLIEGVMEYCDTGLIWLDEIGNIEYINQSLLTELSCTSEFQGNSIDDYFNRQGLFNSLINEKNRYNFLGESSFDMVTKKYDGGYIIQCQSLDSSPSLVSLLNEFNESIKKGDAGHISNDILKVRSIPLDVKNVLSDLELTVRSIVSDITHFGNTLNQISECDLDISKSETQSDAFSKLESQLMVGVGCLTQALHQTAEFSDSIAGVSADIAGKNSELVKRTNDQASSLQSTSASMEELSATVKITAENSKTSSQLMTSLNSDARDGEQLIKDVNGVMEEIAKQSKEIESFVDTINSIAFQTQILALNAAVEAARAGEDGRGFAVVASEVKSLAKRSTNVTQDISKVINKCIDSIDDGYDLTKKAREKLEEITKGAESSSVLMSEISIASQEQSIGVQQATDSILHISQLTDENDLLANNLFKSTNKLDNLSEYLTEAVNVFKIADQSSDINSMHIKMRDIVINETAEVSHCFANNIQSGKITLDELFGEEYIPIPKTNPEKFTTSFDQFTDNVLPSIQESILEKYPSIVYAIATDKRGYVPTHNNCFSQQLTYDYDKDLAISRTKRVFKDRVGITCGTHQEDAKVQTYRRDTGELMFDISSPIYVQGKHWGGFRIGYRIDVE